MKCPKCSSPTFVVDTRDKGEWERRRQCKSCDYRFATVEIVRDDLRRIRLKANAPDAYKNALRGVIKQIEGIIAK